MHSIQQKTLLVAGQGGYFVRATGKPTTAPAALRNTTISVIGVSRYETIH